MISRFFANLEKCGKYTFLGGPPRLLRYYIGGVIEIYYNITWGGGIFPIYYNITRGGSLGTLNLYYVIYGRPLTRRTVSTSDIGFWAAMCMPLPTLLLGIQVKEEGSGKWRGCCFTSSTWVCFLLKTHEIIMRKFLLTSVLRVEMLYWNRLYVNDNYFQTQP